MRVRRSKENVTNSPVPVAVSIQFLMIEVYDYICVKLMVTGVAGRNGLAAPRLVDLAELAGQETVTTQLQLMEAETVRDQA